MNELIVKWAEQDVKVFKYADFGKEGKIMAPYH